MHLLRKLRRVSRMVPSRSTTLWTLSAWIKPRLTRNHISATWKVCLLTSRIRIRVWSDFDLGYMKKVKEAMKEKGADDETVTAFEKGAQSYAKKIVGNFKDYDFYVGESMDPDGMWVGYVPNNSQLLKKYLGLFSWTTARTEPLLLSQSGSMGSPRWRSKQIVVI